MTTPQSKAHVTLHGVFLEVFDMGVLLTGASGIGKSEIALGLINRGHSLVADDIVEITKTASHSLIGTCPQLLQDFLEVRGLGILNIRAMYGDGTIKPAKTLHMIVNIVSLTEDDLLAIDRIHGMNNMQTILDIAIPVVSIPLATGRNYAILVEAAVRNHALKNSGFDAGNEFIFRQNSTMKHREIL